ncbi:unnamed protein product [Amaranthus hypochondriacus]
MDLIFLLGLTITIIIILITKKFQSFITPKTCSKFSLPFPPGKKGWPLIGETPSFVSSPKKFILDRMKTYNPNAFQTSIAGEKVAILCGPTANKFIFSNENKLLKFWLPNSVSKALAQQNANPNSNSYKMADEIAHKFLKLDNIQKFVGIMDSMAQQHLDTFWVPSLQVKVHPLIKEFTFELSYRVFVEYFNPNLKSLKELRDPFFQFIEGILSTPLYVPGMPYYKALKASKIVQEKIFEMVEKRKNKMVNHDHDHDQNDGDLLGRFLMVRDEDGSCVSKEDIARVIVGFIFASFYTTTTTITFTIAYLSKHPHVYDKVLQEQMDIKKCKGEGEQLNWMDIQKMKYTWNVICETMRLKPPSPGGFKEAITDFNFAGFHIPKGWKIHWSAYSTNMNPKYFENPEKFDPSRFEGSGPAPYTFVPFGGGPRMCIGKEYAKIETLVFLHNLVTKFKFKMVNPNENIFYNPDPIPVDGLKLHLQLHS